MNTSQISTIRTPSIADEHITDKLQIGMIITPSIADEHIRDKHDKNASFTEEHITDKHITDKHDKNAIDRR